MWYAYNYSEEELRAWSEKLDSIEKQAQVVYAYFNNHYNARAPANALQLLGIRGGMTEAQEKAMARVDRHARKKTTKMTDFY